MHLFPTPPRLAVVGVLLLGLLLASCSSDGSESFGPSTTATTLSTATRLLTPGHWNAWTSGFGSASPLVSIRM